MRRDEFPIVDKYLKDVLEDIKADIHYEVEMHEDGEWYMSEKNIMFIIDKYINGKENNG